MGLVVVAAAGWLLGTVAHGHAGPGSIHDDAAWTR
jgi:hypothetical protein